MTSYKINKVLIADDIEQECVDVLKQSLPAHDAVIVRSATKITAELVEAGGKGRLRLVGRAGTGVDNIDVPAASKNGVLVMNTPRELSIGALELSASLSRHVAQADASMKAGKWARKDYMGEEVYGRTLAVIGLGRIGREVAVRMQAFGMTVIGYDPVVSKEDAAAINIESLPLEQIWPRADYITVHVPLIPATENLIGDEVISKCKRGVRIINVARGGIVDEAALLTGLEDGRVGGAALDVFLEEPPKDRSLASHARVIATPHLGASTIDAQLRVASEVAENIVALNKGTLLGVLNAKDVIA
ncbi:hypothetical protein PRIPAC_87693 [Pristionchus pacificus]|uniref:D-3-phosphoglycerate dehydrogenase n=1 Tax=Pristionchus pacificus TaxID=54126 RepID=A0A2A6CV21_PRIPA|nr:hypothetical protein PRIPAC_87693 [Pristionchus pacificus]|eukprot:PDM82025.1 hypothetical protein PRIPAC_36418 [Pristionchus pacificus]